MKENPGQAALEEAADKEKMVEVGGGEKFPFPSLTNLTKLDFCLLFIFQNHDFRFGYKISPLLATPSLHSVPCLSRLPNEKLVISVPPWEKKNNKTVQVPNSNS